MHETCIMYCAITVNTICVDIDVLPFLDLGSDANNFTGVDDSSVQFHFPQPFQFNVDMFTSGYVSYKSTLIIEKCLTY